MNMWTLTLTAILLTTVSAKEDIRMSENARAELNRTELVALVADSILTGVSIPMPSDDVPVSVTLTLGSTLSISRISSYSTGYLWRPSNLPDIIQHVGLINDSPPLKKGEYRLCGASSPERDIYRATRSGSGDLKFVYNQPWMSQDAPRNHTIHITVVE